MLIPSLAGVAVSVGMTPYGESASNRLLFPAQSPAAGRHRFRAAQLLCFRRRDCLGAAKLVAVRQCISRPRPGPIALVARGDRVDRRINQSLLLADLVNGCPRWCIDFMNVVRHDPSRDVIGDRLSSPPSSPDWKRLFTGGLGGRHKNR